MQTVALGEPMAAPRLIVEVATGPRVGTKAVLRAGEDLSVGSRAPADLAVPDQAVAPVHFKVSWDGSTCVVARSKRAPGLVLCGERLDAGKVPHGGWVRAGATDFFVHQEARTPPPIDEAEAFLAAEDGQLSKPAREYRRRDRAWLEAERAGFVARRAEALATLAGAPRYAIVDRARSPRIRTLLRESVERGRSLYDGLQGAALDHVAPYLVELPQGSGLLARLVREGWEKRWFVFFDTPGTPAGTFDAVRRHLRRFLMVMDADAESHRRAYFRFYDPVVLSAFLPACTGAQRADFFGPVQSFYAEGVEGAPLQRFDRDGPELAGPPGTLLLTQAQRTRIGDPTLVDRMVSHFRRNHLRDVAFLREVTLRRRLRHGIAKARGHGLTWEYGLTVFVANMLRLNPRFDEHPAVRRALSNPALPPDERVDALFTAVSRAEWEEAASIGDRDAYWRPIDDAERV